MQSAYGRVQHRHCDLPRRLGRLAQEKTREAHRRRVLRFGLCLYDHKYVYGTPKVRRDDLTCIGLVAFLDLQPSLLIRLFVRI